MRRDLPIDALLPQVVDRLGDVSRLVLRAPPGAGKTTRVPAAILDAGLAGDKQVVVLEPRRIAARSAAAFVAAERGGIVGAEVGYRVRFEQRGGNRTRLWFVTEGILGRQLASDPFLERVGVLVLDEFHERHLQGDVALAVARELQRTVRDDLKLIVMSATLETTALAAYLDGCPVLTSEGRTFPVRVEHTAAPDDRALSARVAASLRKALESPDDDGGDFLVFLPGAADIRRVATAIASLAEACRCDVVPMHGDLPLDAQELAIRRGPRRKVVLSTNVAETALTIEGVTTVIDSGLARVARFDARRGVNALRVAPISRAAAEQRAGRAGRTAPGRCLRLWTRAEHEHRLEREVPEVVRLDLSATVLELHAWGLNDVSQFAWLDPPRPGSLQTAEQLIIRLGAIEAGTGRLTEIGRRMLTVAAHPRLARMLVEARQRGCGELGALVAALASERDICLEERAFSAGPSSLPAAGPSDLLHRAELFERGAEGGFTPAVCRSLGIDARSARAVERTRRQLARAIDGNAEGRRATDESEALRCVLAGFPDRVVRRREPGARRGVMAGGIGVVLAETSVVREAELFVAVEVEAGAAGRHEEARVRLASAVEPAWLHETFPGAVRRVRNVELDWQRERVVARTRELYEDLVLGETLTTDVDSGEAGAVLAEAVKTDVRRAARVGEAEDQFLLRLAFLAHWMPDLALSADVDAFLTDAVVALCDGKRSFAELRQVDLVPVLQGMLSHTQRAALEREVPSHYALPNGRRAPVEYDAQNRALVSARVQEVFGLTATPRLAGGRAPLLFQLLAPNRRPVQITDDLESFWHRTYAEVRKDLRGRYPKHAWPEDPMNAKPLVGLEHRRRR